MTGKEIMDDFSLIVLKAQTDIFSPLTAPQLSAIVTAAETLILNEISKAPCGHFGSRYRKEGEETERCGICSRNVEDSWSESLSEA
jgi:hypothetical protein